MTDLRVVPWKRYGHDRLYVNDADAGGEKVAWLDRGTGRLTVLVEAHREAAVRALAPYLSSTAPPASPPRRPPATPRQPAATPAAPSAAPRRPAGPTRPVSVPAARTAAGPVPSPNPDLAANRPGEALLAKIDELAPGFWRSVLNLLLGRRSQADSWRKGLAGERAAAVELDRLAGRGWRVLHSIPLPRGVDIDHLLIGPGGVFSFNTKHHPGAQVWVGDEAVKIGGQAYPYVRKARAEARRASAALSRACGFEVPVEPVLAFVGTDRLTVVASLRDVRAIGHREIAALGRAGGVWSRRQAEVIYAAARERGTWSGA
ncbi:nuclease-related domain-containing protein [Streptantibioticus silvisoli]|uniref:Nuclease-related domain-containing protein n=1 Tax=Streptantibioticus silvisoli TaxID=2705255 RepID=A0ABT6W2Q3_9ACTN|nr:nuclease-related domain-containing protein [Streptantibioticus silvisoli]MDI5965025.1 nuclease-related domain-containing protein [Streptantibioticus silvisoli]